MATTLNCPSSSLVICATIAVVFFGQGWAVEITAEPKSFTKIFTGQIQVTCSVNDTEKNYVALQLSKVGEANPLAVLRKQMVKQDAGLASNMKVTSPNSESLLLTITDPKKTDAGKYTCTRVYFDSESLTIKRTVAEDTVEYQDFATNDTSSTLDAYLSILKKLSKGLEKQGKQITQLQNTPGHQGNQSLDQVTDRLDSLEEKQKNISMDIKTMCNKCTSNDTAPVAPNDVADKVSKLEEMFQDVMSQQNSTIQKLTQQLEAQTEAATAKINDLTEKERNNSLLIQDLTNKVSSIGSTSSGSGSSGSSNGNTNATKPAVPSDLKEKVTDLEETVQRLQDVIAQQNSTIQMQGAQLKNQDTLSAKIDELSIKLGNNSLKIQALDNQTPIAPPPVGKDLGSNVTQLEKAQQEQVAMIGEQNNTIHMLHKQLSEQVGDLAAKEQNNSLKIQALSNTGYSASAFSAGYDSQDALRNGQTILFRKVMFMEGTDYNTTSGVFTAPRKGLYVFHLLLTTKQINVNAQVDLKKGSEVKATLFAWNKNNADQSSVTAVVHMEQGDQIRPVVKSISVGASIYAAEFFSLFSGYLLQPL